MGRALHRLQGASRTSHALLSRAERGSVPQTRQQTNEARNVTKRYPRILSHTTESGVNLHCATGSCSGVPCCPCPRMPVPAHALPLPLPLSLPLPLPLLPLHGSSLIFPPPPSPPSSSFHHPPPPSSCHLLHPPPSFSPLHHPRPSAHLPLHALPLPMALALLPLALLACCPWQEGHCVENITHSFDPSRVATYRG